MARQAAFVVFLCLAGLPRENTAQTSTARVVGRVVDAATGAPIFDARVTFAAAPSSGTPPRTPGPPSLFLPAATNLDGLFVRPDVPLGRWRVTAQKTGFFMVGEDEQGLAVDVTGSRTLPDIQMDRGGAIAGRVLDQKGNPVSDVNVLPQRVRSSADARPNAGPIGNARTNDLGQFRLAGLPPGEYRLLALPPTASPPLDVLPSRTVFMETHYPGVSDVEDATLLTVTKV